MFKKLLLIILFVIVGYFVYDSLNYSYAYQYQSNFQYKLFYDSDIDSLNKDIFDYVSNIDDIIMVNATYEDSSMLVENYSFLTDFAIKYILLNEELFKDNIISGEDFKYINYKGEEKYTNKYVSADTIYFVTDWYFGIKDYYIDIESDNLIPLMDKSVFDFNHKIKSSTSYSDKDVIKSNIVYDDNSCYLYTFYVVNNVLKIKNVEVTV